jgi:hypothetical protein
MSIFSEFFETLEKNNEKWPYDKKNYGKAKNKKIKICDDNF